MYSQRQTCIITPSGQVTLASEPFSSRFVLAARGGSLEAHVRRVEGAKGRGLQLYIILIHYFLDTSQLGRLF